MDESERESGSTFRGNAADSREPDNATQGGFGSLPARVSDGGGWKVETSAARVAKLSPGRWAVTKAGSRVIRAACGSVLAYASTKEACHLAMQFFYAQSAWVFSRCGFSISAGRPPHG